MLPMTTGAIILAEVAERSGAAYCVHTVRAGSYLVRTLLWRYGRYVLRRLSSDCPCRRSISGES
jgi:hypothetical protein